MTTSTRVRAIAVIRERNGESERKRGAKRDSPHAQAGSSCIVAVGWERYTGRRRMALLARTRVAATGRETFDHPRLIALSSLAFVRPNGLLSLWDLDGAENGSPFGKASPLSFSSG